MLFLLFFRLFFFFNDTATTEIYTLSLHDALPISTRRGKKIAAASSRSTCWCRGARPACRSEEHTSELQSLRHLVCRLLLEKKKNKRRYPEQSTTNKHKTYAHGQQNKSKYTITD